MALVKAVRTIEAFKEIRASADGSTVSPPVLRIASWAEAAAEVRDGRAGRRAAPLDRAGRHFEPMNDWSGRIDGSGLQGELRRVTDRRDRRSAARPPNRAGPARRRGHVGRRHRRGAGRRPERRPGLRAPLPDCSCANVVEAPRLDVVALGRPLVNSGRFA